MKKILILLTAFALIFTVVYAESTDNDPAIGVWMSIDDDGETPTGYWELYKGEDGKLYGKMIYAIGEPIDGILTECAESYKGYPVDGNVSEMPLINTILMYGMKYKKPGYWQKGRIIDPEDGKLYFVKVIVEGDQLKMRGSLDKLGWLGRSQIWKKSSMEAALEAKANLD